MLDRLMIAFVSCVERTLEYIRALLHDKHGTWQLPPDLIQEIARCLLPDVIAFYETTEGQEEYAQQLRVRDKANLQGSAEHK